MCVCVYWYICDLVKSIWIGGSNDGWRGGGGARRSACFSARRDADVVPRLAALHEFGVFHHCAGNKLYDLLVSCVVRECGGDVCTLI